MTGFPIMISKQEAAIGYLEFGVTFLFIYVNWVGYYHMQLVGTTVNFDLFMGSLDLLLIFLTSLCASRLHYPSINPTITLFLYFFNQISKKTVGSPVQKSDRQPDQGDRPGRLPPGRPRVFIRQGTRRHQPSRHREFVEADPASP